MRTIIFVVIFVVLLGWSQLEARAEGPPGDLVVARLAADKGLDPAHLQLQNLDRIYLPQTGTTLYRAKVVDVTTGEIYGLDVDQTGQPQDIIQARRAEAEAYAVGEGRLDPALRAILAGKAETDLLTVAIWLKADNLIGADPVSIQYIAPDDVAGQAIPPSDPAFDLQLDPNEADKSDQAITEGLSQLHQTEAAATRTAQANQQAAAEAAKTANQANLARQVTVIQQPLLADLASRGIQPLHVSPTAPIIYVELPKATILELARRADVDMIYGPNENAAEMINAKPTQKADVVDGWGYSGSGIRVAVLEGGEVNFGNPYLNTGPIRDTTNNGPVSDDEHATGVAGIIASQHSSYQGIAQGVSLYSANAPSYFDSRLSAAMDWASGTHDVDVINNSWGGNLSTNSLNDHDRHLDYITRYGWSTVINAAGNEGAGTGRIRSPGRAFNVLTVGNYHDRGTLTWDDDLMNNTSSYIDPSTGVEKPEVAASGTNIYSTLRTNPWIGSIGSGTSFSAPMVSGLAALLMDRDSGLEIRPAAVKAIVIATALHNIEGDSRLSDRDGAGGVDMRAAFRLVDEGQWFFRDPDTSPLPYSQSFYVYAGETVRVAIAWYSNPSGNYSSDPLQLDADLRVYDPNGLFVTSSTSGVNNFEIIQFTAAKTGYYQLQVIRYSYTGSIGQYPPIGVAWWTGHRALSSNTIQTLGTPPVSRDYFRFSAGSGRWHVVGIRPPSTADYDITLYNSSAFGDPADHTSLANSAQSTGKIDFTVIDRNHATISSYYPEVYRYSGTGNYSVDWSDSSANIFGPGTYGPYNLASSSVVRIWDIQFNANQKYKIVIRPASGSTANLGASLFDSNPFSSASYYQRRSQALVTRDVNGNGQSETLEYTNPGPADWLGLVVFKNNSSSTTFYIDILNVTKRVYLPALLK